MNKVLQTSPSFLMNTIEKANHAKVDLFLIGGSLLKKDTLDDCLSLLKEYSKIETKVPKLLKTGENFYPYGLLPKWKKK